MPRVKSMGERMPAPTILVTLLPALITAPPRFDSQLCRLLFAVSVVPVEVAVETLIPVVDRLLVVVFSVAELVATDTALVLSGGSEFESTGVRAVRVSTSLHLSFF